MPPEVKKLLTDMLEATECIQQFAEGRTLEDLRQSKLLRSGIYFQFMIVGEALTQVRRYAPDLPDLLTNSHKIVGFRNQLVHGYSKLDDEITWRIIETHLPLLRRELTELLAR